MKSDPYDGYQQVNFLSSIPSIGNIVATYDIQIANPPKCIELRNFTFGTL